MKNLKFSRVLAVLVALMMCVGMVSPAFAAGWSEEFDVGSGSGNGSGNGSGWSEEFDVGHGSGNGSGNGDDLWDDFDPEVGSNKGENETDPTKPGGSTLPELPDGPGDHTASGGVSLPVDPDGGDDGGIDLGDLGSEDDNTTKFPCTHTLGDWEIIKKPTCTEAGSQTRSCKCGEKSETETIAATGHDWGEWENVGWSNPIRQRVCKNDSSHIEKEGNGFGTSGTIKSQCEQDGHPLTEEEVTKQPTCTEAGEKTVKCKCGEKTETQTIKPLGHDWGDYEPNTTDPDNGKPTQKVCKRDSSHIRYSDAPSRPADDTGDGSTTIIIKGECEKNGHPLTEEEVTKQPTCTEAGEKTVKCKCGEKTETQTTPATGHAYGEWTVTTPATETEPGEQTRVCANDPSHTEKQEIPATGTTTPVTPVTPVVPDPIPVTPVTPVTPEPPVVIDETDVPLAELPEEPAQAPADETEVIEDADVPLAELPEEEPVEEPLEELEVIEDGAVPLSDVPQTGEASTALWLAAVLIAGMGLVYVNTGKRRQNAR